jgi:ubiquinone/menaquinone biosynthesis C-methylase UbiE
MTAKKKSEDVNLHDQYAAVYDDMAVRSNNHFGEVIFGMSYEYIAPGGLLLDIGIGTGLSSCLFAKAGLEITGLDESRKMLDVCKQKEFAKELRQYDIAELPFPYADSTFSVIVCCGVLHGFSDLRPIIWEAYRLQKPGGILALTIAAVVPEIAGAPIPDHADFPTEWGSFHKHSRRYIGEVAKDSGYAIRKVQRLMTANDGNQPEDIPFDVIIMQK